MFIFVFPYWHEHLGTGEWMNGCWLDALITWSALNFITRVLIRILMSRLNKYFSSFCSSTDDSYNLYTTHLTRSVPIGASAYTNITHNAISFKSSLIYVVFQKWRSFIFATFVRQEQLLHNAYGISERDNISSRERRTRYVQIGKNKVRKRPHPHTKLCPGPNATILVSWVAFQLQAEYTIQVQTNDSTMTY